MKPEKLYRCPVCGDVVTDKELDEIMESGGMGYCHCDFIATDEHMDVWFPRILHEYDVYRLLTATMIGKDKE